MPNHGNIIDQWVMSGLTWGANSIPYQWGSTNTINRDDYKGDINTYEVFDPPAELQGKINVLIAKVSYLLCFHVSRHPQCTSDRDQLKALNELLQNAKPHWASFGSDIAKDVLVSGDASVGMICLVSAPKLARRRKC